MNLINLRIEVLEISSLWCEISFHSCWSGSTGSWFPVMGESKAGINENSVSMSMISDILNELWVSNKNWSNWDK